MNQSIRDLQIQEVELIKSKVDQASIVLFVNNLGLTVSAVTDLRGRLKEAETELKVHKNTLTRLALNSLAVNYDENFLFGPTVMLTCNGNDPIRAAKVLTGFAKENEAISIKGGILQNAVLAVSDVQQLAALPGRDQLLGQLVGAIKSPITKLVLTIKNPINKLTYALNAIKDLKTGGNS